MASTSKRKMQSSRRGRHVMVRLVENAPEAGELMPICGNRGGLGHITDQCPSIVGRYDEVQMLQGNGNRYSGFQGSNQSFQPRDQNNYQGGKNFGYQRSYQQANNEIMEMLKAMQQDMQKINQLDKARRQKDEIRDKAIQSLTTHMGQLASEVANLKQQHGKLPSDTQANPKNARNIPISGVNPVPKSKCYDNYLSASHVIAGLREATEEGGGVDLGEPVVPI
ncbi:hypothetical protein HanIR_Chr15g0742951 [Helianthus annuus]|nr:hypothetical protein HanIR_Chr15g0742951 [Helianthus annuus]